MYLCMYTHTQNLPRTNTVLLLFGMDGQASSENVPGPQTVAPRDATSHHIWASSAEHLHNLGAGYVHTAMIPNIAGAQEHTACWTKPVAQPGQRMWGARTRQGWGSGRDIQTQPDGQAQRLLQKGKGEEGRWFRSNQYLPGSLCQLLGSITALPLRMLRLIYLTETKQRKRDSRQCFLKTGLLPGRGDQVPRCPGALRPGWTLGSLLGQVRGTRPRLSYKMGGIRFLRNPQAWPTPNTGSPSHPGTLVMSIPLRRPEFTSSIKGQARSSNSSLLIRTVTCQRFHRRNVPSLHNKNGWNPE